MEAKITRLSDGRVFDYLHGIHSNGGDLDWYATVSDEDAMAGEEVELEWDECIIQLPFLPNIVIDEYVDSFDADDWLLNAKGISNHPRVTDVYGNDYEVAQLIAEYVNKILKRQIKL